MQRKTKSRLVNCIFVLFCCTVFAWSIYRFWQDLNSSSVRTDKTKIADIYFKKNIAQRKFIDRVVWERLQQGDPLYDNDTIRTSSLSQAVINFDEGISVEIDESTMIQIAREKDGSYSISSGGGNFTVDTTSFLSKNTQAQKNTLISINLEDGTKFNLEKGSKLSAVTNHESGENSFLLQEGKASVKNADGNTTSIEKGRNIQIHNGGEIEYSPVTVTSVTHDLNLLKFEEDDVKEIPVAWITSSELKDKNVIIETSYDKNFSVIEQSYETKGDGSINIENSGGNIYWRVYSQTEKEKAVTGKIKVSRVSDVNPLSPVDNSVYMSKNESPKIKFSWIGNEYADFYRIEVFDVKEPGIPLKQEDVAEEDIVFDDLEEGNYLWKVRPHYSINNTGYGKETEIQSLSVKFNEELKEPVLKSPLNDSVQNMTDGSTAINFMWKGEKEYSDYELLISKTPDFKENVFNISTSNTCFINDFNSSILPEGTYYWKVKAFENGKAAIFKESDVRKFNIEPYIAGINKTVFPPDNYALEKSKIEDFDFMYKIAPEYKNEHFSAVVQFSKSDEFKNIVYTQSLLTQNNSFTGKSIAEQLSEGTYFWRVGVKDLRNGEEKNFSYSNKLTLLKDLEEVVIISPENNKTSLLFSDDYININWQKVEGADYYEVKLFDENNNEIKQDKKTTEETVFTANIYPSSFYKVTVQPFAMETDLSKLRIGKITEQIFKVRKAQTAQPVFPVQGQKIDGLDAMRSSVMFEWKKNQDILYSKLILSRRLKDGTWKSEKEIDNPKEKEKITGLKSGQYKYMITALGQNNINLSSKDVYFSITEIPPLLTPVSVFPLKNYVIDSAYLRKHRNIVFDWNDVEGATDYKFILYKKNADNTVTKIAEENVRKSELKFKDLRTLDLASFEWQVTAYARNKDGFVEQKSEASANVFTIKFDLPQKIQAIDSGVQYGE